MNKHILLFLLPVFLVLGACHPKEKVSVNHLQCEHVVNPIGLDVIHPRLSWQLTSSVNGEKQTAYQVIVATDPGKLNDKEADMWNSGKVKSGQSSLVSYAGKKLKPSMEVWWKTRIWDKDDHPSGWSKPGHWEMGFLSVPWDAQWIGSPRKPIKKPGGPNPAFYFRKDISLPATPGKARAYISGLGYYVLYINGKKVSDHVLSPNHSNYSYRNTARFENKLIGNMSTRVYYETFDITSYLKEGTNTLGVILGNGWFFQHERLEDTTYTYGMPRLIAQCKVMFPDGTQKTIVTDTTWKTSTGPIVHNGIYTGVIYDARKEQPGWNQPGFREKGWVSAIKKTSPTGKLIGQIAPPDREIRLVHPISLTRIKDSLYRYDLGEMISGRVRLKVHGSAGTKIILKFIEELGPQYGQTDTYVLKGQGTEIWEPKFTWHGFRYVEVTSPISLDSTSLVGVVVNTDVPQTGSFACSNALFNRINENYIRTQEGNMHGGVPSDCPHRERRGYTGDGQISAPAAICNFNMAAFYTKWINDIADAQNKVNGYVPNTAPYQSGGGGTPWGSAYIIIPWYMYLYYGDTTVLIKHYKGMKQWIDYLQTIIIAPGIIHEKYLGEWVPPEPTVIPPSLVSTAYYYHDLKLMESIASVLGKTQDATGFKKLAIKAKNAFNKKYFHQEKMSYSIGRQGANVFALGYGLVPDEYIHDVFRTLVNHIEKDTDGHFDTGMMGTPLLLQVLSKFGRPDLAYTLMNQNDFPSYGLEILKGSTTLWETWDGTASHSHPMFGSVCQWFYNSLAGINPDPLQPGFKHIIIRPQPVSDLHYAKARYLSPYGPILSSWTLLNNEFILRVTIPSNTTATIQIPAIDTGKIKATTLAEKTDKGIIFTGIKDHLATYLIPSGRYRFTSDHVNTLIPTSMLTTPLVDPQDTLLFKGNSMKVMLHTDREHAVIRYTLDGTDPDASSSKYNEPITIEQNTLFKARVFKKGLKPGPVSRRTYSFIDPEKNGLRYAYYPGLWHHVSDIVKLTPKTTGTIHEINLDEIPYNKDQFGLMLTGEIEIPVSGTYTFYLTSNDGSKLYMDDKVVVDNDGGHASLEKSGKIRLTDGRHSLKILYFQLGGGYFLSLGWAGPNIQKQLVPPCDFFLPEK